MKNIIVILIVLSIFSLISCAQSKDIEINGKTQTIIPYGWANEQAVKNDSVVYQICKGNIIWCIIGFETVIIPVALTGWSMYEPVRSINQK